MADGLEDLRRDGGLGNDALNGAGSVAEDGEQQLTAGAQVIEPGVQGDGSAFMFAQVGNRGDRCGRYSGGLFLT